MLHDVWMSYRGLWFSPAASVRIKFMSFIVPSPENVLGLKRGKWHWHESVLNHICEEFHIKHKLPMMLHPQWSSLDRWFHSAVCDHIHQSRSFCQEIKTQYKYDYINIILNEIRSADLPLWTQQDSLSRGDGGDPDRWLTFLQVNVPSWRLAE